MAPLGKGGGQVLRPFWAAERKRHQNGRKINIEIKKNPRSQ
jgi:hypothetical protein